MDRCKGEQLEQLICLYLDGEASPDDVTRLSALVADDRRAARSLASACLVDSHISDYYRDQKADLTQWLADRMEDDEPVEELIPFVPRHQRRSLWTGFGQALLVAAACVAMIIGVWWIDGDSEPLPRIVELRNGTVEVMRSGQTITATPGMTLMDGDRLAIQRGASVAVRCPDGPASVDLYSATATFGTRDGGSCFDLGGGLLTCEAAPLRTGMAFDTPHASVEIVGTRLWVDVLPTESTLAVMEGTAALSRDGQRLLVNVGEMAVADAAGLRRLSPVDAWFRSLLVEAEMRPWDAMNYDDGLAIGRGGVWKMDARQGNARRRIWQMASGAGMSVVMLDKARWKRAVLTGRMMILPEGKPPPSLDVPTGDADPGWKRVGLNPVRWPSGVYMTLYFGAKEGNTTTTEAMLLDTNRHSRGAWYRVAVYFDASAPAGRRIQSAVWPVEDPVPPAVEWGRWPRDTTMGQTGAAGIALMTQDVPALWEGIKLVPLGADMRPPPTEED